MPPVNVTFLKGVKGKRAAQLRELGIETVEDLVRLVPRYYEDRTQVRRISELAEGLSATVCGRIMRVNFRQIDRVRSVLSLNIEDDTGRFGVSFFNQRYIRGKFEKGATALFFGRVTAGYRGLEMINPEYLILGDNAADAEDDADETGTDFSGLDTGTNTASAANLSANPAANLSAGATSPAAGTNTAASRAAAFKGIFPVYPLTQGLSQNILRKIIREALALLPPIPDRLPAALLRDVDLPSEDAAIRTVHCPRTLEEAETARRRLAFDELLETRLKLLLLKRSYSRGSNGYAFGPTDLPDALRALLPFTLTDSQEAVWRDIRADMAVRRPMNRLIMGDVGSGKTVLAMLGMLQAIGNGMQAAYMAPTEVLAEQHYNNIAPLFGKLGVSCALLTGALTGKNRAELLTRMADGSVSCVIGTHALIQEGITWHRLGLAITDEQHRFGVRQRGTFLEHNTPDGRLPDVMVMTATPIPRTLGMILYGDMDISRVETLPTGRKPIITYLDDGRRRERIYKWAAESARGGDQVYIVHAAIGDGSDGEAVNGDWPDDPDGFGGFGAADHAGGTETFGGNNGRGRDLLSATQNFEQCKDTCFAGLSTALLHGRMNDKDKNDVMRRFAAGEISVLFSTTVIEVGVDVANATIMLIENSERFGLSQLHQLRGRVGRGSKQSYCVLLTDHRINPDPPADDLISRRLLTLRDCLSGDKIAEEDLKLRGPGDFFGVSQHGLPAMRVANLYTDSDLLEASDRAAQTVLNDAANYGDYLKYVRSRMPDAAIL